VVAELDDESIVEVETVAVPPAPVALDVLVPTEPLADMWVTVLDVSPIAPLTPTPVVPVPLTAFAVSAFPTSLPDGDPSPEQPARAMAQNAAAHDRSTARPLPPETIASAN